MTFPTDAGINPVAAVLQSIVGELGNSEDYLQDIVIPSVIAQPNLLPGMEGPVNGKILKWAVDAFYGSPDVTGIVGPTEPVPMDKGPEMTNISYYAKSRARGILMPRDKLMLAAQNGDKAMVAVREGYLKRLMSQFRILRERDAAALFFAATTWGDGTTDVAPANGWDVAAGDPIKDLQEAFGNVRKYRRPNTLILGAKAADNLRLNDAWLQYLPTTENRQYTNDERIKAALRSHFGLARVEIGYPIYNASLVPGTMDGTDIWGDGAWMGFVEQNELGSVTAGTTDINMNASAVGRVICTPLFVDEYELKNQRSNVLQVEYKEDTFRFQNELGCYISATTD